MDRRTRGSSKTRRTGAFFSRRHHPENLPSGRILVKLGFTLLGETFFEPTGRMHPWYLLRAEEYRARRREGNH